jgi:magnesium-transporting ATPase (P-type)
VFVSGTLGIFIWAVDQGETVETARTLSVNMLIAMEIVYLFSIRYAHTTSFTLQGLKGTPAVWIGVITILALQAAFIWMPPIQSVFGTDSLTRAHVELIFGMALIVFVSLEAEKYVSQLLTQNK